MFLLKASSVAFCPLTGSQLLAINLQMDVPVSELFWSVAAAFLLRLFLFVFCQPIKCFCEKKSDPSSSFSSSWVSLLVSIGASFGSSVFSLLCPSLHP